MAAGATSGSKPIPFTQTKVRVAPSAGGKPATIAIIKSAKGAETESLTFQNGATTSSMLDALRDGKVSLQTSGPKFLGLKAPTKNKLETHFVQACMRAGHRDCGDVTEAYHLKQSTGAKTKTTLRQHHERALDTLTSSLTDALNDERAYAEVNPDPENANERLLVIHNPQEIVEKIESTLANIEETLKSIDSTPVTPENGSTLVKKLNKALHLLIDQQTFLKKMEATSNERLSPKKKIGELKKLATEIAANLEVENAANKLIALGKEAAKGIQSFKTKDTPAFYANKQEVINILSEFKEKSTDIIKKLEGFFAKEIKSLSKEDTEIVIATLEETCKEIWRSLDEKASFETKESVYPFPLVTRTEVPKLRFSATARKVTTQKLDKKKTISLPKDPLIGQLIDPNDLNNGGLDDKSVHSELSNISDDSLGQPSLTPTDVEEEDELLAFYV